MKKIRNFIIALFLVSTSQQNLFAQTTYNEPYRPQIHFSPKEKWMNDPNGMIYYGGIYHLFFQYYPDSTVWGPMHWGHATSVDLIHWQQQPIALYPDSLGYIFSGSVVADYCNTSGFGKNNQVPLVAIFTQHDPAGEKEKRNDFQRQSIAFSLDSGKTWNKYAGNPVLKNPGIADFRDPKVMWYEPQKKWIMILAVKDHVSFYSSPDLKEWTKESDFGKNMGAHGGVWECPDLFTLKDDGKIFWIITASINPGAPNGGSGTQYFIGNFNGKTFTAMDTATKWIDYGTDNYAGVTWSNTGDKKYFIGWMSNWLYAMAVPTSTWRSANTLPRELKLKHVNDKIFLTSQPVKELDKIQLQNDIINDLMIDDSFDLSGKITSFKLPCRIDIALKQAAGFSFVFSNSKNEKLETGYDKNSNQYFIDRANSGKINFQKDFAGKHFAPRLTKSSELNITLILDESSVELFADDGLTTMTDIFFPSEAYKKAEIQCSGSVAVKKLSYAEFNSIWR